MELDKKIATGGLNSDSAKQSFPDGDYGNAINFHINNPRKGEATAGLSILGTKEIPNTHLPTDIPDDDYFVTVGSFEDGEGDRMFYFVAYKKVDEFGDDQDDYIFCHEKGSSEVRVVLQGEYFDPDSLITEISYTEDTLFWIAPIASEEWASWD